MAKGGKPTAGRADVRKAKHDRKYGSRREMQTEANRRRKRLKHVRVQPNDEQTKKLL